MPPVKRYWVITRLTDLQTEAVGPHTLYKIRLWVAKEILPPDVQICEEGGTTWIKAKDLQGFYDFPAQLRVRLERDKARVPDPWDSKPAMDWQISYLKLMRVPFKR